MDTASQAAQIASARAMVWLGTLPPHNPAGTSLATTSAHRDAPEPWRAGARSRSWLRNATPGIDGRTPEVTSGPRTGPLLVGLWRCITARRPSARSASSVAGARP